MPAPLFVVGHRNPDTDAVCSAVGYAALLRLEGHEGALAARQGPLRPETRYVLDRFGVAAPVLVDDVRPRVVDVMTSEVVTIGPDSPLMDAGTLLREPSLSALPVTEGGRLVGVCGISDLAQALINLDDLSYVEMNVENLLDCLDGTLIVDAPQRTLANRLMVAAMDLESMVGRLQPGVLLVIGDREDAQRAAIEAGAGALVVTGDQDVKSDVIELARRRDVRIITTPHHTFTTLRRIQLSSPVRYVMRTDVVTCAPDDLVEEAREQLQSGPAPVPFLVVVEDDGTVRGLLGRTNLLRPHRTQLALVDHNERAQSVVGIEEAEVVAVVDHHRVADFWTRQPPFMRLEPVGATSTIVAKLYREAGLTPDPGIAGVLLSGIVTDTLGFRGPTTTSDDLDLAHFLADAAEVDMRELGDAILAIMSDVSHKSADDILLVDFKEFTAGECRFGIGTIETTRARPVLERRQELLDAMSRLNGYTCVMFAVIDVAEECTTVLTSKGAAEIADVLGGKRLETHTVEIDGIVSRKKNIVPRLGAICSAFER